jgi:hypothetical protein
VNNTQSVNEKEGFAPPFHFRSEFENSLHPLKLSRGAIAYGRRETKTAPSGAVFVRENVINWTYFMPTGEFQQRHQGPDHNARISEINARLSTLTPGEAEQWSDDLYEQTARNWRKCNNSFGALFDRLKLFNTQDLNLFDIIIATDEHSSIESYIRIWKDNEDAYCVRELQRMNGQIVDWGEIKKFSDTYEYQFGPQNRYVATIKLREHVERIKLERSNGELVDQRSQYETSVLLAALETKVLPSIEQMKLTLENLWNAVRDIEPDSIE